MSIPKIHLKEPINPKKLKMIKDSEFEMAYRVELPLDSKKTEEWEVFLIRNGKIAGIT